MDDYTTDGMNLAIGMNVENNTASFDFLGIGQIIAYDANRMQPWIVRLATMPKNITIPFARNELIPVDIGEGGGEYV